MRLWPWLMPWYCHASLIGCAFTFTALVCALTGRWEANFWTGEIGCAFSIAGAIGGLIVHRRLERNTYATADQMRKFAKFMRDLEDRDK